MGRDRRPFQTNPYPKDEVVIMDITQIQEKKNDLETVIEKALNEFENDTQTTIERIEMDKFDVSEFGVCYKKYVNRVRLDVRVREKL